MTDCLSTSQLARSLSLLASASIHRKPLTMTSSSSTSSSSSIIQEVKASCLASLQHTGIKVSG